MKTVTDNQLNGELGETNVKARVQQLGHVFEGRGRLETGVDGTIEFRDPMTRAMTGKTVAVQVKTTAQGKYVAETDAGFEYLLNPADLTYWTSTNLPVILIAHRFSDNSFYWKSVSDGLAGEERRLIFVKAEDKLDETAMDRIAQLAVERGRLGSFVPPMRTGEPAHLNLMRVGLPDEIFIGESPFASGRNAVPALIQAEGQHFDWVIRGRRFVSFRDPRGTPLEAIVDADTVEAVDTELLALNDDPEDEVVMIELLRRTMQEQVSPDLAYDRGAKVFHFRARERFATREYRYRSLREATSAMVVQVYMNKKRPDQVHSVRHLGFSPRFERIGDEWFLSISPTYVFTEDGFRPHRFASDLVAGKKRFDRNASVRGQFFLFRFLLSNDTLPDDGVADMFAPAPLPVAVRPHQFIRFEPVEPVTMDVAVPEDAWVKVDPNAKVMRAEPEPDGRPVQQSLRMSA